MKLKRRNRKEGYEIGVSICTNRKTLYIISDYRLSGTVNSNGPRRKTVRKNTGFYTLTKLRSVQPHRCTKMREYKKSQYFYSRPPPLDLAVFYDTVARVAC